MCWGEGVEILGDNGAQLSKCDQNGKGGPFFALEGAQRVRTPGTLGLAQACCLEFQDAVSCPDRSLWSQSHSHGRPQVASQQQEEDGLRVVSVWDTPPFLLPEIT